MGSLADYVAGGTKRYQVTAACVVAIMITADGKFAGESYVYRHGIIPLSTDPAQIEHLIDLGMIREIEGSK